MSDYDRTDRFEEMEGRTDEAYTQVEILAIPPCQLHHDRREGDIPPAYADAEIAAMGHQWGYVCESHFNQYGCSLGLGKGQELIAMNEPGGTT